MAVKLFLLGLCLLAGGLHAAPQEPSSCQDVCVSKFHGSELDGCKTGCRLMDIEESITMGMRDLDDVKGTCQSSCQSSYGANEATIRSCSQGCELMVPFIKSRHSSLRDPFASFFGNDHLFNQVHLPQIFPFSRGGEPKELAQEGPKRNAEMFGNFGNVISNMHRIMDSVMQRLKNGELMGDGKVVVIKARPGHYETETYDLSPQSGNSMNDMMNKMNPLDDFFNQKPKEDDTSEKGKDKADEDVYGVEFVKPLKSNNLEKEEDWVIEPILPETGLKSRIVHEDNICNRHPEYMSWSNYFYCVDRRISTSGWWIYVCILPLACLLLLRVCMLMAKREADTLVPLPMTSHKDVLAKAKEAEANASVISIVTIPEYQKSDLPPAYEDVTNLKVALVPLNKESPPTKQEEAEHKNEAHA